MNESDIAYTSAAFVMAELVQNRTRSPLSSGIQKWKMFGFLMHAYFWVIQMSNSHREGFMHEYARLKDYNSRRQFRFGSRVSDPKALQKETIIQYFNPDGTFPIVRELKDLKPLMSTPQFVSLMRTSDVADAIPVCEKILAELKQKCTISNVSYDGCCVICGHEFLQVVALSKCGHVVCDTCRDGNPRYEYRNVKRLKRDDGT